MPSPAQIAVRRLNPFAFPAETDVRFILLIVTALTTAIIFGQLLRYVFASDTASVPPDTVVASPENSGDFFQQQKEQNATAARTGWRELALPSILTITLFSLATFVYRRHPARLRRRFKLEPLRPEQAPAFYSEVQILAACAGLVPAPAVEMNPSLRSQGGQAFGRRGEFSLRLDSGLRVLLLKSPAAFRALVLHELGHIVNHDVARTYFAQAIWVAAIGVVLVPLAVASVVVLVQGQFADFNVTRLFIRNLPALLWLWLQAGVILAVMAAMRASLLRGREFYADWRAAIWGGESALAGIFRKNLEAARPQRTGNWRSFWKLHPTPAERLAALENPGELFRADLRLPLLVGFLLAMVVEGILVPTLGLALGLSASTGGAAGDSAQSGNLQAASAFVFLSFLIVGVIVCGAFTAVSWLLAGTVGAQVQREAVGGLAAPQIRRGAARIFLLAAFVALGMEAGFAMMPGLFGVKQPADLLPAIPSFLLFAAWAGLCLAFSRFTALRLLRLKIGPKPPKALRRWLTVVNTVVSGVALLPVLLGCFLLMRGAEGEQRAFMLEIFAVFAGLALALYAIAFGIHAMLAALRHPRCPLCRKPVPTSSVPGGCCGDCGAELASWLFITPPNPPPRLPMAVPPVLS
jgi:Zn-dependent protease with chaperone function